MVAAFVGAPAIAPGPAMDQMLTTRESTIATVWIPRKRLPRSLAQE
jgi:hypothetical protein